MPTALLEIRTGRETRLRLISQSHHESQRNTYPRHVVITQTTDRLTDAFSAECNRFISHHLRSRPQSIRRTRFDQDAKTRRIDDFRCHLANDNRRVLIRERIGLNDNGGARLTVIAGRGNDYDVTAPHRYRIQIPTRSSPTRRVHPLRSSAQPVQICDVELFRIVRPARPGGFRATRPCAVGGALPSFAQPEQPYSPPHM